MITLYGNHSSTLASLANRKVCVHILACKFAPTDWAMQNEHVGRCLSSQRAREALPSLAKLLLCTPPRNQ